MTDSVVCAICKRKGVINVPAWVLERDFQESYPLESVGDSVKICVKCAPAAKEAYELYIRAGSEFRVAGLGDHWESMPPRKRAEMVMGLQMAARMFGPISAMLGQAAPSFDALLADTIRKIRLDKHPGMDKGVITGEN